jgi:hypothetical protein
VARVPPAAREVAFHRGDDTRDDGGIHPCEAGRCRPRRRVEDALRVRPERSQHPIRSVARDHNGRDDDAAAEPFGEQLGHGKDAVVERGDLGEVVRHEPHRAAHARVVGQDHDRPARDAAELAHSALPFVVPRCSVRIAMAASTLRSPSGSEPAEAQTASKRRRTLRNHDGARLDRDDAAVGRRFVRAVLPTLTTLAAPSSAAWMLLREAGSSRRRVSADRQRHRPT